MLQPRPRPVIEFFLNLFKIPYVRSGLKFVPQVNFNYYCMRPDSFILSHAPTDAAWQLLQPPLNVKQFESTYDTIADAALKSLSPQQASYVADVCIGQPYLHKKLNRCDRSFTFNEKNARPQVEAKLAIGDSVLQDALLLTGKAQDSVLKIAKAYYTDALRWNSEVIRSVYKDHYLQGQKNDHKKRMLRMENDSLMRIDRVIRVMAHVRFRMYKSLQKQTTRYLQVLHTWKDRSHLPNIYEVQSARIKKDEWIQKAAILNDSVVACRYKAQALKDTARMQLKHQDSILRMLGVAVSEADSNCDKQNFLLIDELYMRIQMDDSYDNAPQRVKAEVKALKYSLEDSMVIRVRSLSDTLKLIYRQQIKSTWRGVRSLYRKNMQLLAQVKRSLVPDKEVIYQFKIETDSIMSCADQCIRATRQTAVVYKEGRQHLSLIRKYYTEQIGYLSAQRSVDLKRWMWTRRHLAKKRNHELRDAYQQQSFIRMIIGTLHSRALAFTRTMYRNKKINIKKTAKAKRIKSFSL